MKSTTFMLLENVRQSLPEGSRKVARKIGAARPPLARRCDRWGHLCPSAAAGVRGGEFSARVLPDQTN